MNGEGGISRLSVKRRIPGYVRVVQILLYLFVAAFALIGTWGGTIWLIPALGTLILCWYTIGQARVTYEYRLEGALLKVNRISGFRAHPKSEEFLRLDLNRLIAAGFEDAPELSDAEAQSAAANPRRITYDVSAHDPKNPPCVLYATGIGRESGRFIKVYAQMDDAMRSRVEQMCPGRAFFA